jgi:p-aminobenzoyl-glutamate transporter AbgT
MDRRASFAAGLDTFFIVLFVAIGRRNHDEDPGIGGLVGTAAPFLIALAIAWVALRAWHRPTDLRTGLGIWVIVVAAGMLLRHFVFDHGTATSFIIVATLFLGFFIVGWRLVFGAVERRRPASTSSRLDTAS